jgi:hypothetical protein
MDNIIDSVKNDNRICSNRSIESMFKTLDACFSPMLLYARLIFSKNSVSTNTATNNRSVIDAKFNETARKAIGPRLCGDRITKCDYRRAILSSEVINGM